MQRKKADPKSYQNGQIYAIRSYQTDMIYIGSTCTSLSKRFYEHKIDYKLQRKYISSFEILKYDDAYIELLEDYPCKSKKELERREGQLIRENKQLCVNVIVIGRTRKQYREDNSATLKQKEKKYRAKNKSKIKERRSSKYLCECGKYSTLQSKSRHLKSKYHKKQLEIFDYSDMILEVEKMTKEFADYFKCKYITITLKN